MAEVADPAKGEPGSVRTSRSSRPFQGSLLQHSFAILIEHPEMPMVIQHLSPPGRSMVRVPPGSPAAPLLPTLVRATVRAFNLGITVESEVSTVGATLPEQAMRWGAGGQSTTSRHGRRPGIGTEGG